MRWAIVIGIDEYGAEDMRLSAAVSDALAFSDWAVHPDGGGVPAENLRLLLSRREGDERGGKDVLAATKDNIVTKINEVVVAAGEEAERLCFYFSGHGITARVASRDESAIVTPGFTDLHTDHSLAVRSITEFLETTPFADQFIFIDACRDVPWENREFEIGRWPVPRRRDPGAAPVQQFILYATSPGRKAQEVGFPGEAAGRFTSTLLDGLAGAENAKAWSWERNCYEVRWEGLANFINKRMAEQTAPPDGVDPADWPVGVPQDTGGRGVAGRDRDVAVVSFPSGHFESVELTVELNAEAEIGRAEVSVLDALGEPVATALEVTGGSRKFRLPPKTYAVRATTTAPQPLFGSVRAPIEVYADHTERIALQPRGTAPGGPVVTERIGPADIAAAGRAQPPGRIVIHSPDPLAVAEIRDETGHVAAVVPAGHEREAKPGFYHVRHVGPEADYEAEFVVLKAGEQEAVDLEPPAPDPFVAELAASLGGSVDGGYVRATEGDDPASWARPSTLVAAGVAAALRGRSIPALGVDDLHGALGDARAGVAIFAVAGSGGADAVRELNVRIWPAGEPLDGASIALAPSEAGVGAAIEPVAVRPPEAIPPTYWVAFTSGSDAATVLSVPVLVGRLATLVAQADHDGLRVFQYHPEIKADGAISKDMREIELLERMLLAGRLDVAAPLAERVAARDSADLFARVVAGYVLLRLGRHGELGELASKIVTAAPTLSDGYILRAEHEANSGHLDQTAQAFADAVNAGIPAFGEGLTRLVEGLRANPGVTHPRAAIVRHIFQRHARGSMWAAFGPRRGLSPGSPVIRAADVGLEA